MKKLISLLIILGLYNFAFAQEVDLRKVEDSVLTEGYKLYRSEFASWYGTDVFTAKCKEQLKKALGYLSYDTDTGMNNIFFSKDPEPQVLATISFGRDLNPSNYKLDTIKRKLTPHEMDLYVIRQAALKETNKDTLFKVYHNTNLNLVPIIDGSKKNVYLLTGSTVNGLVVLGNDYFIEFNDKNEIISKRALHRNALFFKDDPTQKEVTIFHTHLPQTGDFITPTDICTTMLYEKIARWKFHVVMSKNYVSSFDCNTNKLVILTKEAWERIAKSQSEKHN